jgi:hypothetical protein
MPGQPGFADASQRPEPFRPPSAGLGRAPVLFPRPGARQRAARESTLMKVPGLRRLGGLAWLLRTAVTARAYRAAPSDHHRPRRRAPARAGPRRGSGRPRAVADLCLQARCPPPPHSGRPPAGRAHQPASHIRTPARGHRPGPVVRLPQAAGSANRAVHPAMSHQAAGIRIRSPMTQCSVIATGSTSGSWPAGGRGALASAGRRAIPSGQPACPAPFRRPGGPGQRPCPHPILPHRLPYAHASTMSPGSGKPTRTSKTGARAHPGCGTLNRRRPLHAPGRPYAGRGTAGRPAGCARGDPGEHGLQRHDGVLLAVKPHPGQARCPQVGGLSGTGRGPGQGSPVPL